MVGPGAASKAQCDVIVLDVLAAKGVHSGEMIAETDVQIEIVAGENSVARASEPAVVLRPDPRSHQ